jgi:hypothetical protein
MGRRHCETTAIIHGSPAHGRVGGRRPGRPMPRPRREPIDELAQLRLLVVSPEQHADEALPNRSSAVEREPGPTADFAVGPPHVLHGEEDDQCETAVVPTTSRPAEPARLEIALGPIEAAAR